MKKMFLAAALAFTLITPVTAQTVTSGCEVQFDWAGDENTIDGFRFVLNDSPTLEIAPEARGTTCTALGVIPGINRLIVEAFNAAGSSAPSNELSFVMVDEPPMAPTVLRLVITFQ